MEGGRGSEDPTSKHLVSCNRIMLCVRVYVHGCL